MALNDIQPWRSPSGGEERLAFPVIANATFLRGEPLRLTLGGALTTNADNPAAIIGIAAHGATDVDGASFPAGTMCTVIGIPDTQIFRSDNFATDGSGTAAVPTQANAIQELAGLSLSGGTWSIDTGMANLLVRIVDVLDAQRNSITDPNILTGAGQTVLFKFI
jgi:hypothetical protein